MKKEKEELPETNPTEIESLISRVESGKLHEGDRDLVVRLLRLVLMLVQAVEAKNSTISKLKRMLFGPRSDKPSQQKSNSESAQTSASTPSSKPGDDNEQQSISSPSQQRKKPSGHGRIAASRYTSAQTVYCRDELTGSKCPHCDGHLYDTNRPQIFIRLSGRPPIEATRYQQQVLRCSACQARFTASLPEAIKAEKYDESADVTIAIMKYGLGLPLYRLSKLQTELNTPLPASTMYERCEVVARAIHPIYLALQRVAAGSELLHPDDTGIKILSAIKENQQRTERIGLQTTVIGARQPDIALYFSGRRYSGENLTELLKHRSSAQSPPIVMGDAAAKNWTSDFEQIIAKCLAHARRKFVEVSENFPRECQRVIDDLAAVYANDTKTAGMSKAERLLFHQEQSAPIMSALKEWMELQLQGNVEPNSGLGQAMKYFLRHYDGLIKFTTIAGAPLDNNFAERLLKRVVLHRKNALFFKTEGGAYLADTIMSVLATATLHQVNLFEYLLALMKNARAVRQQPSQWLPWNYHQQLIQAVA